MRWIAMLQRWFTGRLPTPPDRLADQAAEQRRLAQELGELQGSLAEQQRLTMAAALRRRAEDWDDR